MTIKNCMNFDEYQGQNYQISTSTPEWCFLQPLGARDKSHQIVDFAIPRLNLTLTSHKQFGNKKPAWVTPV